MAAAEQSIAAEAKGLRILTVFALIAVIVAIMLQYVLPSVLGLAAGEDDLRAFTQRLGVALIAALPAFIFASALSSTEKLFGRLARGELFTQAVGKGVSGIGQASAGFVVDKLGARPLLFAALAMFALAALLLGAVTAVALAEWHQAHPQAPARQRASPIVAYETPVLAENPSVLQCTASVTCTWKWSRSDRWR